MTKKERLAHFDASYGPRGQRCIGVRIVEVNRHVTKLLEQGDRKGATVLKRDFSGRYTKDATDELSGLLKRGNVKKAQAVRLKKFVGMKGCGFNLNGVMAAAGEFGEDYESTCENCGNVFSHYTVPLDD